MPTGGMSTARVNHTATLLGNGKVLVTGGQNATDDPLASAELYDPSTGTFDATGSMSLARVNHTATLLPNGEVLIVGGLQTSTSRASAELYDPAAGTFTAVGNMTVARAAHTATLLGDGKVLIAGGNDNTHALTLASAEIYNPEAGTFSATGSMTVARQVHTATLLGDKKVLIAGGYDMNLHPDGRSSAELYDPAAGAFTATGSMTEAAYDRTATMLSSGKVLFAGGLNSTQTGDLPVGSAELYEPMAGTFGATSSMSGARAGHTTTLLSNGKVLVAGGNSELSSALMTAELYDAAAGTFRATGSMTVARAMSTATLLSSGKVLVVGGVDDTSTTLASAELYE